MSSNLLFVPYRKTQRIEFGKELRDIIAKEYYQTPSVFEADLQEIDTLRNDTIDLQVSQQDLALLKRYVTVLPQLISKFHSNSLQDITSTCLPWNQNFQEMLWNSHGMVR